MKRTQVDARLTVAGQPTLAEIEGLAGEGATLLINNRPDGEEPGQPGTEAERDAAARAGLSYLHLPVTGAGITRETVDAFRNAVLEAPGPVVAHCRSGTRSLNLWVIGEVLAGCLSRDDVARFGAERGYDLSGAVRWLEANGEGGN